MAKVVVIGEINDKDRVVIRDRELAARVNPPLSKEAQERCARLERMVPTRARLRAIRLD